MKQQLIRWIRKWQWRLWFKGVFLRVCKSPRLALVGYPLLVYIELGGGGEKLFIESGYTRYRILIGDKIVEIAEGLAKGIAKALEPQKSFEDYTPEDWAKWRKDVAEHGRRMDIQEGLERKDQIDKCRQLIDKYNADELHKG